MELASSGAKGLASAVRGAYLVLLRIFDEHRHHRSYHAHIHQRDGSANDPDLFCLWRCIGSNHRLLGRAMIVLCLHKLNEL